MAYLPYAFTYQLPPAAIALPVPIYTYTSPRLNYYDAYSERHVIQDWYNNMVKSPLDETTSMIRLYDEAGNVAGKSGSRMLEYLQRVRNYNKWVPGLTSAECLTVQMYTDGFAFEYNPAMIKRNWRPYRVYTTIVISALQKLSKIYPIQPGLTLYRGISFKASPPTSKTIVWKALTSTSLNIEVAKKFTGKNGMILKFKPPSSSYAARVGILTRYIEEDEVILFPLRRFDFLFVDSWGGFNFRKT